MIRAVIVDDEATARHRMRRLLEDADVRIVGEADGAETALALIDALKPDVAFLDIQMPGSSGLEIASHLKRTAVRTVFCTAFDQFAMNAFEQHAAGYLLKPVSRERLASTLERIRTAVHEQHAVREAARTQARLMPPPRTSGGLACAGISRPAQDIGGDCYDILHTASGRVALTVADVSGKGLYAGLLAAALQARLQSLVEQPGVEPGELLSELNRLTAGTIESHRFITLFLAFYDPNTFTISYASAGHPPALLVSPSGEHRWLDGTGPAIGWGDVSYTTQTIDVAKDDVIAIYSDGIPDTVGSAGSELGMDGLVSMICRHATRNVEELASAVFDEIDCFSQGAPGDDRTLLVARVA